MFNPATLLTFLAALSGGLSGCIYFSTEYQINYGLNHYEMGLYKQAIPPLMSAAKSLERKSPPDPRLVEVLIALGVMAERTDRSDLAADFYPGALKAAEALNPQDKTRLRNALVHSGLFCIFHQRSQEAVPLLERAVTISDTFNDQVLHAIDLDNLALAHQGLKQYSRASDYSMEALNIVEGVTSGKLLLRTKGIILHNLAISYVELGRYKEAEARLVESLAVLKSAPNEVEPWRLKTATKSYAHLLRRTDRVKEAEALESQVGTLPALKECVPADGPRPPG